MSDKGISSAITVFNLPAHLGFNFSLICISLFTFIILFLLTEKKLAIGYVQFNQFT